MSRSGFLSWVLMGVTWLVLLSAPLQAAPNVALNVASADEDLTRDLRAASLTLVAIEQEQTGSADLVSAALADYKRFIETLYAYGYYSGVVRIRVDGREVASLSLVSLPGEIRSIEMSVDPGPQFRFGQTSVAPLAPGDAPPEGFAPGEPAFATVIRVTSQAAVVGWREAGYAKAQQGDQRIVADHAANTLSADLRILPGPKVRFGDLIIKGDSAVRREAMARIAGFPGGREFSPDRMSAVATRLRRTGAFASVSLREGEVEPDGSMDVELTVVDRKPRRFGVGAELTSFEGLDLTGFWMHRNIFGGAENLRVEAEINQIGAQTSGIDYLLSTRLTFPALLRADVDVFAQAELESVDDPLYALDRLELTGGIVWYARAGISAELAASLLRSRTVNALGERYFSMLSFPAVVSWDRRDDPLDATTGTFLRVEVTPYVGFSGTASGARFYADARGYRSIAGGRAVIAGRVQWGSILGSSLTETYPDFLFYSGGGGTVRGQPYQSLGVGLPGINGQVGGRSFLGTMLELRTSVTESIGAVVFADTGFIGSDSFVNGSGDWHAGAGVGLRYNTGIGPLRVDVAAPVQGTTGDGVQIYIGIGQAF